MKKIISLFQRNYHEHGAVMVKIDMPSGKPVWSFLYDALETHGHREMHNLVRVYRSPSPRQACTKMAKWAEAQEAKGVSVRVDYELEALHVQHTSQERYVDLYAFRDHAIQRFLS